MSMFSGWISVLLSSGIGVPWEFWSLCNVKSHWPANSTGHNGHGAPLLSHIACLKSTLILTTARGRYFRWTLRELNVVTQKRRRTLVCWGIILIVGQVLLTSSVQLWWTGSGFTLWTVWWNIKDSQAKVIQKVDEGKIWKDGNLSLVTSLEFCLLKKKSFY